MTDKRVKDMTDAELANEAAKWQLKLDKAKGWGAAVGAAAEFLEDAQREQRRRRAERAKLTQNNA